MDNITEIVRDKIVIPKRIWKVIQNLHENDDRRTIKKRQQ